MLAGLLPSDGAGVVQIDAELASVAGVDLIPAIVDDPATLGSIAAAHACNRVLAMGARVTSAQLVAVAGPDVDDAVLVTLGRAAGAVVADAGGALVGAVVLPGEELHVGLAVQGVASLGALRTADGAEVGDVLLVTKRLGTGLLLDGGSDDERRRAFTAMAVANRPAAEILAGWGDRVRAVTDIGPRGLAAAAWHLSRRSGQSVRLDLAAVPLYRGAFAVAEMVGEDLVGEDGEASLTPAGRFGPARVTNRAALWGHATSAPAPALEAVAYDPQYAGGLLVAVDPGLAVRAADAGFVPIGEVTDGLPLVELR